VITAEYRVWPARRKLLTMNVPVVLAGDYNVAPTGLDIYSTTSWDDDALVQPPSRAAYAMLVEQGWTVAFRKWHPHDGSVRSGTICANRWQRKAGLRLDHHS
jgi:exodeoxyribonuclease III